MERWGIGADEKVLLILSELHENVVLSVVTLVVSSDFGCELNVYDLLAADRVV